QLGGDRARVRAPSEIDPGVVARGVARDTDIIRIADRYRALLTAIVAPDAGDEEPRHLSFRGCTSRRADRQIDPPARAIAIKARGRLGEPDWRRTVGYGKRIADQGQTGRRIDTIDVLSDQRHRRKIRGQAQGRQLAEMDGCDLRRLGEDPL